MDQHEDVPCPIHARKHTNVKNKSVARAVTSKPVRLKILFCPYAICRIGEASFLSQVLVDESRRTSYIFTVI